MNNDLTIEQRYLKDNIRKWIYWYSYIMIDRNQPRHLPFSLPTIGNKNPLYLRGNRCQLWYFWLNKQSILVIECNI